MLVGVHNTKLSVNALIAEFLCCKENINFNYVLEESFKSLSLGAPHCGLCWAHRSSSRALSAAEITQ